MQPPTHTSTPAYIKFGSGSSAPMRWLSNLSYAPFTLTWPDTPPFPQHMRGRTATYATSEHAYQALRSLNKRTAREFEIDGSVNMHIFHTWPKSKTTIEDIYNKKHAYWIVAKNSPGIAPKMIAKLKPALAKQIFSLDISPNEHRAETLQGELLIWRPILTAKLTQNTPILQVLVQSAPSILVEFGRFRVASQYWSAYVDVPNDKLIGKNMMGRLLMTMREELHDE